MTVVGITMVRDEADIIEHVIRHMATQVDAIIVADNLSTDGTDYILHDLIRDVPVPLQVYADDVVAYEQSKKMTALANMAHDQFGANWIVPFDADEIWYAPGQTIKQFLSQVRNTATVECNLYDHVASAFDDDLQANPIARIQWRREYAAPLPKVACRWHPSMQIGMGNHDVAYKNQQAPWRQRMAIRHFPYRSPEQVIRKIRNGAQAYAATDLPDHYGAHWRGWGQILDLHGPGAIEELFRKWHWRENPDSVLIIDGEQQPPLRFDPACDVTSIC